MAAEANVFKVGDCKSTPLRNISNTVLSKEACVRKLFLKTEDSAIAAMPAIEDVESTTSPPANTMKNETGRYSDFMDKLNGFEKRLLSPDVAGSISCPIDVKEPIPYNVPDAPCIETVQKERDNENNSPVVSFQINGNNQREDIHTISNEHTCDKECENFVKQCNFGLSYEVEKNVKSILLAESINEFSNGFSEIASHANVKDEEKINTENIDLKVAIIENKYSEESVAISESSKLLTNSTLTIDEIKASEHINCMEDFPKVESCMVTGLEVCTDVSCNVNNHGRELSKQSDCFKVPPLKRVIGIQDNIPGEQNGTTEADVDVIYIKTINNSPVVTGISSPSVVKNDGLIYTKPIPNSIVTTENNSQSVVENDVEIIYIKPVSNSPVATENSQSSVKNDGLTHNNGTSFSQSNNEDSFDQKEREIKIVDISKKKNVDVTNKPSLMQISSNHVSKTEPNVERIKSGSNVHRNISKKKDDDVEEKITVSIKSNIENKLMVSNVVKSEVEKMKTPSIDEFVSDDPSENDDNNNPEWELLRKLETDEERYKVVRSRWRNLSIPDPNKNLTSISIKSCFMQPSTSKNCNIGVNYAATSRKRTLSSEPCTSSGRVPAKRARTRSCTTSYDLKMENQRKMLENEEQKLLLEKYRAMTVSRSEYIRKLSHLMSSNLQFYDFRAYTARLAELHNEQRKEMEAVNRDYYGALLKLEGEHQKKISSLNDVIQEVEAFHKFYRELDRDNSKNDCYFLTDHELDDILETEKLYNEFNTFYS